MKVEINYLDGMLYALASIIIGVLFTLMNGLLRSRSSVISFMNSWQVSPYNHLLFVSREIHDRIFVLTANNWTLILILASVCTPMLLRLRSSDAKTNSYTVMLTTNLEPVYGIIWLILSLAERK
jgi:hypothetical protein